MNQLPAWAWLIMLGFIGAIGGFINWVFNLKREGSNQTRLGNILFGALGPIFILGIYGGLSSLKINEKAEIPTVGVAVSSLALGFGGARVWSSEMARRELEDTKANLALLQKGQNQVF